MQNKTEEEWIENINLTKIVQNKTEEEWIENINLTKIVQYSHYIN